MQLRDVRLIRGCNGNWAGWRLATLSLVALLPLVCGCNGCQVGGLGTKPAPDEILKRMVTAYREAKSYEDKAVARVSYKRDGKREQDEALLGVKYSRPNRLALEAYQLDLTCDGKQLRALIEDPASDNLHGQVLDRAAPADLALADLLADEETSGVLTRGLCRLPVQLELLLSEKPLELFLDEKSRKKSLSEEKLEDQVCHRLEVTTDEGTFVLWIDRENYVLRRLEYPAAEMEKQIKEMVRQNGGDPEKVSDVQLVADFRSARFGATLGDRVFAFAMPAGGKLVPKFMRPPAELPSPLFGQRPEKFSLTTLAGETVSQAELDGKIAVLLWFVADEPSKEALTQFDNVREEFASQEGLSFHAVFADEKNTTDNDKVRGLLADWKIETSVLRDAENFGGSSFHIQTAPTLVILDAAGQVQIFEPGVNPELAKQLPTVLKRLLKGDDLAAELVAQDELRTATYQRHLNSGRNADGTTIIELPPTKIEPWQAPELFKLTKLWTCVEVDAPGNLIVVEESDRPPRILVHSETRAVVELDAKDGRVIAKHELPQGAAVSFLRTAVDKSGKRYYLAGANPGKQIHLLDEAWKPLLAYPREDDTSDPVLDAQLFDLDGEGPPEIYLGYGGVAGVQQVSLAGKRAWNNKSLPAVMSLAQSPPNVAGFRKMFVTGERGTVLRLNQFGIDDPEIRVGDWAIHRIYAARFSGPRVTQYVGLSTLSETKVQVVALDEKLVEQWSYPLPEGVFRNPIEYVASGMLLDTDGWFADVPGAQWIFAGVNGSVHVVSDDGDFNDFFNSGENLTGIAATRFNGAGMLLLSSDKGVTAWRVEPNSVAK